MDDDSYDMEEVIELERRGRELETGEVEGIPWEEVRKRLVLGAQATTRPKEDDPYPLDLPEEQNGERWPAQGEWTYEDYARLPDDGRRYEVIRGHLYVSPAPAYEHQFAVSQLLRLLGNFVFENELGVLLPAPFDVKLPDRIADPVQPDLVFIRTENQPRSEDANFAGVPDLVVEVLSPSTHRVDLRVKLEAYRDAGILEYWLVDPQARTIVIYHLNESGMRYFELDRGSVGQSVSSGCLAGAQIPVEKIFPPK